MRKKVFVLSGSPRAGGNCDLLCEAFARGAAEAGHEVVRMTVADREIGFCRACYGCRGTGSCVLKDDMDEILPAMLAADVLVLASPVYFYAISAQMKAVIDRTLPVWAALSDRELYYLMTAAAGSEGAMAETLASFRGFARCLKGSKEKGVLCATGVYEPGTVSGTDFVRQAYEMGRSV